MGECRSRRIFGAVARNWRSGVCAIPADTPCGSGHSGRVIFSTRGGLFSNATQALKEVTGTYKYSLGDGFDAFLEYRHDWTNIRYFVTNNPALPRGYQDTVGLGLVWWYGGKQGSW